MSETDGGAGRVPSKTDGYGTVGGSCVAGLADAAGLDSPDSGD
jgi:hypothetical protein